MGIELEPVLAQVTPSAPVIGCVGSMWYSSTPSICLCSPTQTGRWWATRRPRHPEIKTASYHSAPVGRRRAGRLPVARYCINSRSPAMPGRKWRCRSVVRIFGFTASSVMRRRSGISPSERRSSGIRSPATSSRARWLQGCWLSTGLALPRDDGETVDLSPIRPNSTSCSRLLHLREHKEEVELRESQIKQRLQATLGEATAGLFADGKITWKRSKDRLAPIWTGSGRIIPTCSATMSNQCPAHAVSPFKQFTLSGDTHHDQRTGDYPTRDWADLYWQAGTERGEMGTGEGRQFHPHHPGTAERGWLLHPLHQQFAQGHEQAKIRAIPVRVLFNDSDLNLRAEYSAFDRQTGRPLCVGNGEVAKRVGAQGMEEVSCPGPERCPYGQQQGCKLYGRLNLFVEGQGMSSAALSFVPQAITRYGPWRHASSTSRR